MVMVRMEKLSDFKNVRVSWLARVYIYTGISLRDRSACDQLSCTKLNAKTHTTTVVMIRKENIWMQLYRSVGTYQMCYSQIECTWKRKGIEKREEEKNQPKREKRCILNLTLVITWPGALAYFTAFGFTRRLQLNRQASDRSTVSPYDTCFTSKTILERIICCCCCCYCVLQRFFAPFFQLSIAQNYYYSLFCSVIYSNFHIFHSFAAFFLSSFAFGAVVVAKTN